MILFRLLTLILFLMGSAVLPSTAAAVPLPSTPTLLCEQNGQGLPELRRSRTNAVVPFSIAIRNVKNLITQLRSLVAVSSGVRRARMLLRIADARETLSDIKRCRRGELFEGDAATPTPTASPTPIPSISATPSPSPSGSATPSPSATPTPANLIRVGPTRQYQTLAQALAASTHGQLIEIDAATYSGSAATAVITRNNLTIRGVGGRPIFDAAGAHAQGKGTWVIQGSNTVIENIEMLGAAVPDQNGAAIRQEGQDLTVLNCYLHDNQNGILSSIANTGDILIAYSELARNGFGNGLTHNIYINAADSFTFIHNYSHHAWVGHLVKSRATTNYIMYNRLMDEDSGTASYEIDLPNGGTSYIIGNTIQQSALSQNGNIIAYGAEGLTNSGTTLYVINNTIVNDRGAGTFIFNPAPSGLVYARNNLFVGPGTQISGSANAANNLQTSTPNFVNRALFDYRLTASSPGINGGVEPGSANGVSLSPIWEYQHSASRTARPVNGALDLGAFELP